MMQWSLLFIALGLGLLAAAFWQLRVVQRHKGIFDALQKQAGTCAEPLAWPSMAWPHLQRAGFLHVSFSGHWFGHPLATQWGASGQPALAWNEEVYRSDDILIHAAVASTRHRGESKWLAEQAWQLFLLHWRTMLREREKVLDTALVQRAEHALMLKHDLRNFA